MKRLLEVVLVLTVISLGVIHGHYHFTLDRGFIPRDVSPAGHPVNKVRFTDTSTGTIDGSWDYTDGGGKGRETGEGELPSAEDKEPSLESRLEKVDRWIERASRAGKYAAQNPEYRTEYTRKALEYTREALDILNPLQEKYPDNPEIERRLQAVTRIRQSAVKDDSAR